MAGMKSMFLDIETTGLRKTDEVLQLAFITTTGKEFNRYYKPIHTKEWPEAQEVNNITYDMVRDKMPFEHDENLNEIQDVIDEMDIIVGHNIKFFDIPFLEKYGLNFSGKIVHDTKTMHKKAYPNMSSKLVHCAEHYKFEHDAHDALEDVKACKYVYERLVAEKPL